MASQLEEIGFFQQVKGETPRFEGGKLALGGPAKVAHGESAMDAYHAPLPLGGEQQKGLGKNLIAGFANVGLDPHAIKELKNMFRELRADGRAVLISTHMIDSVEDYWDVAHIMMNGEFAATCRAGETEGKDLEDLFFSITEGGEKA